MRKLKTLANAKLFALIIITVVKIVISNKANGRNSRGAWTWSYGDRLSDVNNFLGEQSPWLKDDLYFKFPFGYQTTKYTGRSFVASPVKEDEFVKPQRVYVRYSGNSKNGYTILANVLDHIRNFARNRRKQGENQKPVKHILEFNDLLPPTVEHRVPQLQYNYNQRPPVFSDSHNNNNNPFESIESLLDYLKQNSSRTNEKSDSGEVKIKVFSNPDKLPFFLGILPATLCTLLVLGYPPFQVLLIGAYITTVFVIGNDGINRIFSTKLEKQDFIDDYNDIYSSDDDGEERQDAMARTGVKFLMALKWLDNSIFAPLLTETNMKTLYQISLLLNNF